MKSEPKKTMVDQFQRFKEIRRQAEEKLKLEKKRKLEEKNARHN